MSKSPALNAMTPPRHTAGQVGKPGRPFNPNTRYPVKLAERLREGFSGTQYTNTRIEVDPNINFSGNATDVTVNADPVDSEGVELTVSNKQDSSKQHYRGEVKSDGKSLWSLTFDAPSQTLVLDRIDASVSFSAERPTTTGGGGGAGAGADGGSDESASDSDGIGTPDPDNPYDWRHQLKRRGSGSSPPDDDAASVLSGVDSVAGSPAPPKRFRKASTPPDNVRGGLPMHRGGSQTTAASTPARDSDVEIDLDDDPGEDGDDDDDGNGGGLEIIPDGTSAANKRGRNRYDLNSVRKPQSLTSLASSRTPSRQPPPPPPKKSSSKAAAAGGDDDDDFEIEMDRSPPPRSHRSFTDQDVSDVEVPSPVHRPQSPSLEGLHLDRSPPAADDGLEIEIEPEREQAPADQHSSTQQEPGTANAEEEEEDDDMAEAVRMAFEQGDDDEGEAAPEGYPSEEEVSEEE